jgi:hypothetical protein
MQDGEGAAIDAVSEVARILQFEFSYERRQQMMRDVWTIVHLQFFKGS